MRSKFLSLWTCSHFEVLQGVRRAVVWSMGLLEFVNMASVGHHWKEHFWSNETPKWGYIYIFKSNFIGFLEVLGSSFGMMNFHSELQQLRNANLLFVVPAMTASVVPLQRQRFHLRVEAFLLRKSFVKNLAEAEKKKRPLTFTKFQIRCFPPEVCKDLFQLRGLTTAKRGYFRLEVWPKALARSILKASQG